jgi:hypothetical protein
MVRGYEVAKGQYMIVEDVEIKAVQIESTRTIDIDALRWAENGQANYSADAARKPAMSMMKVAAHQRRSVGMTEIMAYTWG